MCFLIKTEMKADTKLTVVMTFQILIGSLQSHVMVIFCQGIGLWTRSGVLKNTKTVEYIKSLLLICTDNLKRKHFIVVINWKDIN